MRIISFFAGGAPPAMTALAMATACIATPVLAMDDQATYWRFDGRVEKRLTSVAPATEWATSAWIGDDSTKLRLQNSGVIDDTGHIDNEGGTRGIDNRFFYSHRISDYWDAKAVHRLRPGHHALGLHRRGRGCRAPRHPCRRRAGGE